MLKKFIGEAKFYFLIKAFLSFSWLISIKIYAHFLSPSEYGFYSILQVIVNLFALFAISWLSTSVIRFIPTWSNDEHILEGVIFKLVYITLSMIFFVFLFVEILLLIFNIIPELNGVTIILNALYFITHALILFIYAKLSGERKLLLLSKYSIFQFTLSLLLGFFFLSFTSLKVDGIILSWVLTNVFLLVLIYYKHNFIQIKLIDDADIKKQIFDYGLPVMLINVLSTLLVSCDQFIIKYYGLNEQLGIYAANYSISDKSINAVTSIFTSTYVPIFFTIEAQKGEIMAYAFHKKIIVLFLVIIVPILIISIFVYPNFSNYYFPKAYYFPELSKIIMCGTFFWGISLVFSDLLTLKNRTLALGLCYVVPVVFNIISNFVFIPIYGIVASAYNSLVSYIILCVFVVTTSMYYNKNYLKINLKNNKY